ncbi:MAG: MFS transporter [Phycisphaerae bacterium]
MTSTAAAADDSGPAVSLSRPVPGAWITKAYGLGGGGLVVLALLFLGFAIVFSPMDDQWSEAQAYSTAAAVLSAAGICLVFSMVLLGVRKAWAMVACALSAAALAAACWFSFTEFLGHMPLDVAGMVLSHHWPMRGFFTVPRDSLNDFLTVVSVPVSGVCLFGVPLVMLAALPKALAIVRGLPLPIPQLAPRVWKVGTLRYTFFGMFMVFVWVIWGDFIYTLLDGAIPGILPLKLNNLGAGDTVNTILNKTTAYAIDIFFAPVVSVWSDRHRGPNGRRIPFMTWTTPFVGLFLVMIGHYDSLTNLFMGNADTATFLGMTIDRTVMTLIVFGIIFVLFDYSNLFVGTVYYYLFNDVVPSKVMSQFFSFFRIAGTLAGILYNGLVFPYALTHFKLIFTIAGIGYAVGFMLMCFMVKEGRYPPPAPLAIQSTKWKDIRFSLGELLGKYGRDWQAASIPMKGLIGVVLTPGFMVYVAVWFIVQVVRTLGSVVERMSYKSAGDLLRRIWARPAFQAVDRRAVAPVSRASAKFVAQVVTFCKECFTHRFYWYFFLTSTCTWLSWQIGMFATLRNVNSLHLNLTELGRLGVYTGFVSLILQYPAGWLSDKFSPVRTFFYTSCIGVLGTAAQCIFLFGEFSTGFCLGFLIILSLTLMPFNILNGAASYPMYMQLLPKEKYGQFCSANALMREFAMIFGSVAAGGFMEFLDKSMHMGDFRYRFYPVWIIAFQIPAVMFTWLMYREWKARGGEKGYTPPET